MCCVVVVNATAAAADVAAVADLPLLETVAVTVLYLLVMLGTLAGI